MPRFHARAESFGGLLFFPETNTRVAVNHDLLAVLNAAHGAVTLANAVRRIAVGFQIPLRQAHEALTEALRQLSEVNEGTAPTHSGLSQVSISLKAPALLILEVTAACNQRCAFCYETRDESIRAPLAASELMALVDAAAAMDVIKIQFMGGEPTLHPFFPELVARACRRGLFVSFTTNGTHLSEPFLDVLQAGDVRSHLLPIQVSIHGASPDEVGAWLAPAQHGAALASCKRLADAGIPFGIKTIVARSNVRAVHEHIRQAAELHAVSITLLHLLPVGGGDNLRSDVDMTAADLRHLAESVEQSQAECPELHIDYRAFLNVYYPRTARTPCEQLVECPAGNLDMRVRYDGLVIQCSSLRNTVVGDVRRESLAHIWDVYRDRRRPCPYPVGSLVPKGVCE